MQKIGPAAATMIALLIPTCAKAAPVSFDTQIHPILRQWCQGCHQPSNAGGKLILTSFAAAMAGGDQGKAIVPGRPDQSLIVKYVSGPEPKMPMGGPPLSADQIELLKRWIQEGARDDTSVVQDTIDSAHPPVYAAPPATTALAYSPDGAILAVSGYHETLLHHADGSGLVARLVGKAQQIESLVYSPDGKMLAAVGGSPALFGEAQFWDTEKRREIGSASVSYDVLFGASFSPDGKELAFGGADGSARVIAVPDGKPILKFDNHTDWVFGAVFSTNGKDMISAGRDQSVKLTEIQTGSFIDDINKHYDALRCVARNPKADQVVCAGQDAIPRLYQIFRTVARTMNDEDHNLIREFEKQAGPVNALAYSADGSEIAVASSGDEVVVYGASDGQRIASLKGHAGGAFAVAFSPDGRRIATGGFDGIVRIFNLPSGALFKAFTPVPLSDRATVVPIASH